MDAGVEDGQSPNKFSMTRFGVRSPPHFGRCVRAVRITTNDPVADIQLSSYFENMSEWMPATKEEVERALARAIEEFDISNWSHMLVDPFERMIERFDSVETAFVVAVGFDRVVYFDDVEEDFGTAEDVNGRLKDAASYGSLPLALSEAAAGR